MRRSSLLTSLVVVSSIAAFAAGCGDSSPGAGGSGGTSSSTTTSSSKTSSGSSMTTSSTTTSSTTTTSASSSVSTGSSMMTSIDHLVFSEVAVSPDGAEFFEIWNPTASAVDLSTYYVSDNSDYWEVPAGMPWDPEYNAGGNPNPADKGSDFLGGFPSGTMLAADAVLTVGFKVGFETTYNKCPDYFVSTAPVACNGNMIPAMRQPVAGTISTTDNALPGLSNAREMLVLFTWDGTSGHLVKDADYVIWGTSTDLGSRMDKTGISTYLPDTAVAMQKGAPPPTNGQTIERCSGETSEKQTGGNGLLGHDETSEDFSMSFVIQATPSPGVKNTCL